MNIVMSAGGATSSHALHGISGGRLATPRHRPWRTHFDTATIPESDRLAAWQERISRDIACFNLTKLDDAPFYGKIEVLDLGPIKVNRVHCSPVRWLRSRRELADGVDNYGLFLGASGPFAFRQGDGAGDGVEGHCALFDNARQSDLYVRSGGTDYDIVLQRAFLERTQQRGGPIAGSVVGRQSPTLRLLGCYIDSILEEDDCFGDETLRQRIAEHVADLVVLALRPTRDAAAEASDRGLRSARFRAILDILRDRFCDEGISPAIVAAGLNISERYVHQLLGERGLTFSRHVLDLRLRRAAHLLADSRFDGKRIGQIAYDCGFSDLSYFNRCFRRRFGDTPAGVRSGRTQAV